jgi:hypothetical protein
MDTKGRVCAVTDEEPRRWTSEHPDGGRIDVDGVEWFACDPYPTWFTWSGGNLITLEGYDDPIWKDDE